jgi:hypothetical protein
MYSSVAVFAAAAFAASAGVFAAFAASATAAFAASAFAASSVAAFAVAFAAAFAAPPVAALVAPPVIPDAPEPQLVTVLTTVPDDDWSKSWSVDKTIMLKMTSKSLNEVINKMQLSKLSKLELTVTLRFDNNKESELKMKSLSMFVKNNKIAKLELNCSNVRISTYDLCKVVGEDDAPEWFETVSQHHASLAMLNDQANYFEPVLYDTWYAYSTPGGPDIVWTFKP